MEFFSEIYGCYYQIVGEILRQATIDPVSKQEIMAITERLGFAESGLTIPDKLFSGEWSLLEQTGTAGYSSLLEHPPQMPPTLLQKRWLKALLTDRRIHLFLEPRMLTELSEALQDVEPLWSDEQFYYYDRFEHGDDFSSQEYQESFRRIMDARRAKKVIHFDYLSAKGKETQKTCLPLKIEYSPKNDRFRLIALRCPFDKQSMIERYRLDGIKHVTSLDSYAEEETIQQALTHSLETLMRQSYDTEPVRLLIKDGRNALERAMLHFANYDKDTKQLDENTWECMIYYDSSMETELLIEILSFGPFVQVMGPESFVELIQKRLKKQLDLKKSATK